MTALLFLLCSNASDNLICHSNGPHGMFDWIIEVSFSTFIALPTVSAHLKAGQNRNLVLRLAFNTAEEFHGSVP
jgi:hypothetical protein